MPTTLAGCSYATSFFDVCDFLLGQRRVFSGTLLKLRHFAARQGQHTGDVLCETGWGDEIQALREAAGNGRCHCPRNVAQTSIT